MPPRAYICGRVHKSRPSDYAESLDLAWLQVAYVLLERVLGIAKCGHRGQLPDSVNESDGCIDLSRLLPGGPSERFRDIQWHL